MIKITQATTLLHFWCFFLFVFVESLLVQKFQWALFFFLLFTVFYVLEQMTIIINKTQCYLRLQIQLTAICSHDNLNSTRQKRCVEDIVIQKFAKEKESY